MMDQPVTVTRSKWPTIAALIAGLVSLFGMVVFFTSTAGAVVLASSIALGVAAIVLGIIGLRSGGGKGAAIAGIVTGGISFLLGASIFVFALIFVGTFSA